MDNGMKIALTAGSVLIVSLMMIPLVFGLSAGWETCKYEMEEHGMMGPWMMTGFGGWTMAIFWLVVIGLIVWLVVYLARNVGATTTSSTDQKAIDILKSRYASGEIDKKEYEEKLKDLK